MEGLSLSALVAERWELEKDLTAFSDAYNGICARLVEASDAGRPRRPQLHEWSGSRAVCGALELSIHAVERTIAETAALIAKIESGEIPNTDKPERKPFEIIDGGKE